MRVTPKVLALAYRRQNADLENVAAETGDALAALLQGNALVEWETAAEIAIGYLLLLQQNKQPA